MTIISLIRHIVETVSRVLNQSSLINWINNNVVLANLAIFFVFLLTTVNITTFVKIVHYQEVYPNGKYGLTAISKCKKLQT